MRVFIFAILLLWGGVASAQTAFVVDNVRANLRVGKAENYRILRVLPPQTQVEILERSGDYARVRLADGETGWVLLHLLNIPPTQPEKGQDKQNQAVLEAMQKELEATREEVTRLQGELEQARSQPRNEIPLPTLAAVVVSALAAGVVLGILGLQSYYRRRLHGLRI